VFSLRSGTTLRHTSTVCPSWMLIAVIKIQTSWDTKRNASIRYSASVSTFCGPETIWNVSQNQMLYVLYRYTNTFCSNIFIGEGGGASTCWWGKEYIDLRYKILIPALNLYLFCCSCSLILSGCIVQEEQMTP
jgi:hypothetical protein